MVREVIYVQCPHCKKGWYAPLIKEELGTLQTGGKIEVFTAHAWVQGINPTDLRSEIECLNCHEHYVPMDAHWNSIGRVMRMDEWVAQKVITVVGESKV